MVGGSLQISKLCTLLNCLTRDTRLCATKSATEPNIAVTLPVRVLPSSVSVTNSAIAAATARSRRRSHEHTQTHTHTHTHTLHRVLYD